MELDTLMDRIYYVVMTLVNCWQVKLAASFVLTALGFLVGPMDTAFLALWLLVVIDPVTKWLAIGRQALQKADIRGGIACGLSLAWNNGDLNSLAMRHKFIPKAIGYLLVLIAANLLVKVLPPAYVQGKLLAEIPRDLITSYLAVTEFISILENLTAAGLDALAPVTAYFCKKREDILK